MDQRDRRRDVFTRLAVVGKAFASAKRLELFDLLTQGERTVESLAREAGLGLSTVSAHLQILKLSNLVKTRRDGTRIYYSLAGDDVMALYAAMLSASRAHSADVGRALDAYLGAGSADAVKQVDQVDQVDQVGWDELLERLASGDVVLIDVRPVEEFAAGHIPGARSVPFGDLADRAQGFDPDTEIVAYCRGAYCVLAHDAVRLLRARGLRAARLTNGLLEWRVAGKPITVGA